MMSMRFLAAALPSALLLFSISVSTSTSSGYSVLTHEAIVDTLWEPSIQKLLLARFPAATPEELAEFSEGLLCLWRLHFAGYGVLPLQQQIL